jgi:2-keto-4-pentenoate hydratase/2-oxohepta-3-ene-1,7-dioic acid hydratase in catechol pathway
MVPKVAQPVKDHLPDYEVELTIVIGKDAKNVSEADALDYVLGYVTGNDVSWQRPMRERTTDANLLDVLPLPSNGRVAMGFQQRLR